jgi:hypothetical protein
MTKRIPSSFLLRQDRTHSLVLPASTYNVPLHEAEDYSRMYAYQTVATNATVLDHAQYFSFLSELVEKIWQVLGSQARLFVELRAPYIDSLPENLLKAGILMGSELLAEAEFWAEHGQYPVVWMADQIRRDLDYPGDNSLRFLVWPEEHARKVTAAITGFWEKHAMRVEVSI